MDKRIISLIIPLEALLFFTSVTGLFTNIYFKETPNWQAQALGQDIVDLFILFPVILFSAIMSIRGSRTSILILLGALLYTVYTFAIYCFSVHFNQLFIVYCAVFGLSIYSLIYFTATFNFNLLKEWFNIEETLKRSKPESFLIYLLFILSILFSLIWIGQIVPAAFSGRIPQSISEAGIPTNPVYVLDLSFFLPAIFISALMLRRKKSLGYLLAPSFLIFISIMLLTLSLMLIILSIKGFDGSIVLSIFVLIVAVISLQSFSSFTKQLRMR